MGRGGVALGFKLLPMENAVPSLKGLRVSACVSTPLGALPRSAWDSEPGARRSFHCRPLAYKWGFGSGASRPAIRGRGRHFADLLA